MGAPAPTTHIAPLAATEAHVLPTAEVSAPIADPPIPDPLAPPIVTAP